MKIRKTRIEDLDTVMEVYAAARQFMKDTGNPYQWGDNRPERSKIEDDINKGLNYVCEHEGEILGAFTYIYGWEDPTYTYVENGQWVNNEPYGVMHSVASLTSGKGIGRFCINWALEQSRNVKIDTHEDNKVMQALLEKMGFSRCGTIYLENGDPRIAFQKTV
jgi:GNAT superfamily N-acetyltransferase